MKPGDKILGFDLSHGDTLLMVHLLIFRDVYTPLLYGVDPATGRLDYDKIQEIATKEQPKLIIAGASAYSRDMDFERFRVIADSVELFYWLIFPILGLIAKGLMNDPLPHCHIVTTTTQTLRGPRGGLI
jgi:glycine hydroxymethyltransferase